MSPEAGKRKQSETMGERNPFRQSETIVIPATPLMADIRKVDAEEDMDMKEEKERKKEELNDSRHAPAEQRTTQRKAVDGLITRNAEDADRREDRDAYRGRGKRGITEDKCRKKRLWAKCQEVIEGLDDDDVGG